MESHFQLSVVTGDLKGAGTDANVYVVIRDSSGNVSRKLQPNLILKDDFERGSVTKFDFGPSEGVKPPFDLVEVWRDNSTLCGSIPVLNKLKCLEASSSWFLDRIDITVMNDVDEKAMPLSSSTYSFPVHRWIKDDLHYFICLYDTRLPQLDISREEFRKAELEEKRNNYAYSVVIEGGPLRSRDFPEDEKFSEKYYWTFIEKKFSNMAAATLIKWSTIRSWKSLDGLADIFVLNFERPAVCDFWKEDWWFGLQRVQGCETSFITLCETLPETLLVPDFISELMEGKSLSRALRKKKIFSCDLSVLKGLPSNDDREIAYPYAVFYLNSSDELLPIMIQLRAGEQSNNPVYTPRDAPNTWLTAKMFYNNAEAQYHQAVTHLGITHYLVEGIWVAINRSLSVSHPLFRLFAPHFLYLIAINRRIGEKLINPGGWVDKTMTQGVTGMKTLIASEFNKWSLRNVDPSVEIEKRGVLDAKILPYYPYRDDSTLLHNVIKDYVSAVVNNYYDSPKTIEADWELKDFRKELTECLGLKGVSGNEGGFSDVEEIIETVTNIISICSLGHAAANVQQYSQYGFVPNYPGKLGRDPPIEKLDYTDEEMVALLPAKEEIFHTIGVTNLISTQMTKPLGDFEVQYLFHPKDIKAVDRFRDQLNGLSEVIKERNDKRKVPYIDLDPVNVTNSVSI